MAYSNLKPTENEYQEALANFFDAISSMRSRNYEVIGGGRDSLAYLLGIPEDVCINQRRRL